MVDRIIKRIREDRPFRIFLFILLVGAVLRLVKLTSESLWYDEILTALSMKMPFFDMIRDRLAAGHSPFYFIFIYPFAEIFGNSELIVRTPSAIASILSVYVFYLLAKKLFSDDRISHLSSLLFSLSALNIYFATEARPYAFSVLFAISSFYFLLRALEEGNREFWVFYILSAAANLYCSAVSIPILFAQIAYVAARRRKYADFLLSFSFIVLLYVPMAYFYLSMKKFGFIEWIPPVTWATFENVLYGFGFYPVPVFGASGIAHTVLGVSRFLSVYLIGGVIIFGLIYPFVKKKRDLNELLMPLLWFGVPVAVFVLYSVLHRPIFGPKRYVIALSPAYYMLLAYGMMKIDLAWLRRAIVATVLAFFVVALSTFYSVPTKENWRGAVAYIDSHFKGDDVVIGNLTTLKALEYYEKNAQAKLFPPQFLPMRRGRGSWVLLKEIDFNRYFANSDMFEKSLKIVDVQKFYGLKLYYVK